MPHKIRLSQCMIVKNEEETIRKALSWGKGVVSEQIVVDTGSTDRTVALAESLGAKVFHFDWTGDFSQAKNFALQKASGNWIFFLDADEYFQSNDAAKVKYVLEQVESQHGPDSVDALRFSIFHLNDSGNVFSVTKQDRVFRNSSQIRFQNRIHENLFRTDGTKLNIAEIDSSVPVYHTGYSRKAYERTNKAGRNIELLLEELKKQPEHYDLWDYLGDAYLADGQAGKALECYWKAASAPEGAIDPELKLNAISSCLRLFAGREASDEGQAEELFRQYRSLGKEKADGEYWLGVYMAKKNQPQESALHLEKALKLLEKEGPGSADYLMGQLNRIYGLLMEDYLKTGNNPLAVQNAALALKINKYEETVLNTLLTLFQNTGEKAEGILSFLLRIYQKDQLKDKLFLLKSAKIIGFAKLYSVIFSLLTDQEKEWLDGKE